MRIFLIGFMGSGKTYWGNHLAAQLNLPFFDLDEVIIEEEKRTVHDIFTESGEEYFRVKEKTILENLVEHHVSFVLSCGGGTPCYFNNIDFMRKYGTVIWLNTHVDVLLERLLKEKKQRPLLKGIADTDLRTYIVRKLNERRMYYEQADVIVDNENQISTAAFIQTILHA
jgi:shikimate kinase